MAVTKGMKYLLALLLVVPAAADVSPRPADESGWRVALSPIEHPWTYVDTGGRGEFLWLQIKVLATRLKWTAPVPESMKVRVRFHAAGLPDYTYTESVRRDGQSADSRGVRMEFTTVARLAPMEEFWGRLPSTMSLTVALSEDSIPAVSSPAMVVELKSVPRKDASWRQLVQSLRAGQSRDEVLELLGLPLTDVTWQGANGTWQTTLTYPDPDAFKEFPPELRQTKVFLDQRGRFKDAVHGGC